MRPPSSSWICSTPCSTAPRADHHSPHRASSTTSPSRKARPISRFAVPRTTDPRSQLLRRIATAQFLTACAAISTCTSATVCALLHRGLLTTALALVGALHLALLHTLHRVRLLAAEIVLGATPRSRGRRG